MVLTRCINHHLQEHILALHQLKTMDGQLKHRKVLSSQASLGAELCEDFQTGSGAGHSAGTLCYVSEKGYALPESMRTTRRRHPCNV